MNPETQEKNPGTVKKTNVSSSTLRSIGYNTERKLLEVEFLTGDTHTYNNVPADVYLRFIAAESYTAFFNDCIRNKYQKN